MITMLLGGLWHGANWTFVFWGGYHGLLLVFHRAWVRATGAAPRMFRNAATMLLVIIGWVFFRSETFGMAVALLRKMFVLERTYSVLPTLPWSWSLAGMLLVAGGVAHLLPNTFELDHDWGPIASAGLTPACSCWRSSSSTAPSPRRSSTSSSKTRSDRDDGMNAPKGYSPAGSRDPRRRLPP